MWVSYHHFVHLKCKTVLSCRSQPSWKCWLTGFYYYYYCLFVIFKDLPLFSFRTTNPWILEVFTVPSLERPIEITVCPVISWCLWRLGVGGCLCLRFVRCFQIMNIGVPVLLFLFLSDSEFGFVLSFTKQNKKRSHSPRYTKNWGRFMVVLSYDCRKW